MPPGRSISSPSATRSTGACPWSGTWHRRGKHADDLPPAGRVYRGHREVSLASGPGGRHAHRHGPRASRAARRSAGERVGSAVLYRNPPRWPRARLVGRPIYAAGRASGRCGADRRGTSSATTWLWRTLAPAPGRRRGLGQCHGSPKTSRNGSSSRPSRRSPSYLVLADTFDPGWSATLDGRPVPIRPAYVAFRAVYLSEGTHTVVFTYRPAGFALGLGLTVLGVVLGLVLWALPAGSTVLSPDHATLARPTLWRTIWYLALTMIVLVSIPIPVIETGLDQGPVPGPDGSLASEHRWKESFHGFTWGAKLMAMPENRPRRP